MADLLTPDDLKIQEGSPGRGLYPSLKTQEVKGGMPPSYAMTVRGTRGGRGQDCRSPLVLVDYVTTNLLISKLRKGRSKGVMSYFPLLPNLPKDTGS